MHFLTNKNRLTGILLATLCSSTYSQTEWTKSDPVDFSIRCSKPPRTTTIGVLSATFIDQIYLRFSRGELTMIRYSTPIDEPHNWYNSEVVVQYLDQRAGGKSKISAQMSYRHHNQENYTNIAVELDATAQQSALSLLVTDMVTLGRWEIYRKGIDTTLQETTSTIVNQKLQSASNDTWRACRLMSSIGEPISR